MSMSSRQFASEEDYARMCRLLQEIYALTGPRVSCTVGDLEWWRWTSRVDDAARDAYLWFDGDELIGFAWPSSGEVDLLAHPDHCDIEPAMLDWAEEHHATPPDDTGARKLTAWAFEGDEQRTSLLRERGYERSDSVLCFRMRRLDSDIPRSELPEGFHIRNVIGEPDLERRVAVHRDAFAPSKMTIEKHRNVMHAPTYRPELDLIVEAPDGSFAAYCLVWFDAANRIGIFEPVGCHSAYRQRGLTKAVMKACDGCMRSVPRPPSSTASSAPARRQPSTSRWACQSSIATGLGGGRLPDAKGATGRFGAMKVAAQRGW